MKFLLLSLFVAVSAFAQVDYEAKVKKEVLKIVNLTDSRIDLSSCGTNEGTYAFNRPSSTTVINCEGIIVGTKRSVLVFKKDKSFTYFEVLNCGPRLGAGDQAYGFYKTKCDIRSLETKTLKGVGAKRAIKYNVSWEYSEGSTQFDFKLNGTAYSGVLASFMELMED